MLQQTNRATSDQGTEKGCQPPARWSALDHNMRRGDHKPFLSPEKGGWQGTKI